MLSEENIVKKQSVLHMHNYQGNKLQEKNKDKNNYKYFHNTISLGEKW